MDIAIIAQFALATLLPVAACIVLTLLRRHEKVARIPERSWQVIVGVVFGLIAIYGTEAGIPVEGAMMNVRDAAPLAAGLFFGGPAGVIAGVIGGVERWFAVLWGVGSFTRVACSVATIFAGIYAALLRKYLFSYHIPNLSFAFATGVVAEVLHLILVFPTNPDQLERAFEVTQMCALPMITCVGLSTMLSSLALHLLNHQPLVTPVAERNVARILHSRMLAAVVVAFLVTMGFTVVLQTGMAQSETGKLLQLNIKDVEEDIVEASDANLLSLTRHAASMLPPIGEVTEEDCKRVADELDVAEIDVIDSGGIIVASTEPSFVGFDMASGEQSAEFLVLLPRGGQSELVQSYQPIAYDATTWRKYAGVSIVDGFVQVGYDPQAFVDDLSAQIEEAVKNRHVGQTGTLAVIDEAGSIVSSHSDITSVSSDHLSTDAAAAGNGVVFSTVFAGDECYAMADEVEGYRIVALLPKKEANASRDQSVLITAFMEVLVFAALFLVIYAVIKRVVVHGVRKMNQQLGQITNGNLDVKLDVRTASEFSSLSDDINQTVGVLKESLAVVKADLDMAAGIQANTLPDITSAITERREFELLATMEPAKEVGGDFYDFFLIDEDHLALVVADVSGKGIPAALFMMQSKIVIKMEALSGAAPDEVLARANAELSEKNNEDMFTTVWLGVLELSTGTLTYADAGHEKLALYRNGAWELPPKPNGAVALASFTVEDYAELPEKYHFRNHTVVMQPGDAILQYTDGVTEANNESDDLFGDERLLAALNDAPDKTPDVLLPFLRGRISEFVQGAPQFDDITMLGLCYMGWGEETDKHDDDVGKADEPC